MPSRTAIVTGATGGIGRATIELLAQCGFHVIGTGHTPSKLDRLASDLQKTSELNQVDLELLDLQDSASIQKFVGATLSKFGKIDALVNAAGILTLGNSHEVSTDSFDVQFNTLFKGPFFLMTALIPAMSETGGGVFVNITSAAAQRASPKMAVYAAAKAALVSVSKSLALEYAAKNIRVVCVDPGGVETTLMDKIIFAMIQKRTPLKRLAGAAEIASLVRFILSDEASYMTGSVITIDGGVSL